MSSSQEISSHNGSTTDTTPTPNTAPNAGPNTQSLPKNRPRPQRSRSVRFDLKDTIIPDSKTQTVYPKEGPYGDAPKKDAQGDSKYDRNSIAAKLRALWAKE